MKKSPTKEQKLNTSASEQNPIAQAKATLMPPALQLKEESEENETSQQKKKQVNSFADDDDLSGNNGGTGNSPPNTNRRATPFQYKKSFNNNKKVEKKAYQFKKKSANGVQQKEVHAPFQFKNKNQGQINQSTANEEPSVGKAKIPANVTIHENSKEATAMNALAFAKGNDIHFAPGKFQPATREGQTLIGHELKHVEQQAQGKVKANNSANGKAINDDPALEKEADDFGQKFASNNEVGTGVFSGNSTSTKPIQRTADYRKILPNLIVILDEGTIREGLEGDVPGDYPRILWNIHKALNWTEDFGRSARDWATTAKSEFEASIPDLEEHDVNISQLYERLITRLNGVITPPTLMPEAVEAVLNGSTEAPPTHNQPGHPSIYEGRLPERYFYCLWDIYKALHWTEEYGENQQHWARRALRGFRARLRSMNSYGINGGALLDQLTDRFAEITNPSSGSVGGHNLETILENAFPASVLGNTESGSTTLLNKAKLIKALYPALANILSDELDPHIPDQIGTAATPYNYLYYQSNSEIDSSKKTILQNLFKGRWETINTSQRRNKLRLGSAARLFYTSTYRQLFRGITGLDVEHMEEHISELSAAVSAYIQERLPRVRGESAVKICENGVLLDREERVYGRTQNQATRHRASTRSESIQYEEDVNVLEWTPTTKEAAREELGAQPHHRIHGENIGEKMGDSWKWPIVHEGISWTITANGRFFGLKYSGSRSQTMHAVQQIRQCPRLVGERGDAAKIVLDAIVPHISSEGPVSSVNTYDVQKLTLSGRGMRGGRALKMANAGVQLMPELFPDVDISGMEEVKQIISQWLGESTTQKRFDLPALSRLVALLETPAVCLTMFLGKLNDSIFTALDSRRLGTLENPHLFLDNPGFGEAAENINRWHQDGELDIVSLGIGIHGGVGAPGIIHHSLNDAHRAASLYPQNEDARELGEPDHEQLSRQSALLIKYRAQAFFDRGRTYRSRSNIKQLGDSSRFTPALKQKVTDYNKFFGGENVFNYEVASEIMPCLTGNPMTHQRTAPPDTDTTNQWVLKSGKFYNLGPRAMS